MIGDGRRIATHVGQDEKLAGKMAGQEVFKNDNIVRAICVYQEEQNQALQDRCDQFCNQSVNVPCDEIYKDFRTDETEGEIAELLKGDWRVSNGKLALLALGPSVAIHIHNAIAKDSALSFDDYVYGTFDYSPAVIQAIIDEEMQFG